MKHQILGASCLAPFRPGHDYRPALDELAGLGFNLVRTFCGPLPWAPQERAHVYERLPDFLGDCADRGLNAYLSYVTEAGLGYDLAEHCSHVEIIAMTFDAVVLREVANEPWHPTQGGRLAPSVCAELANAIAPPDDPVCYGASSNDEATDYDGGDFAGPHLDRSRDKWNQVRRVRELYEKRIALNQEPIGADEVSIPGKRESDPAFFFTLGALNRLFLGGSGVFHSTSGLFAEPLGPNQRRCAEAYLEGCRIWPGAERMAYYNVGHAGSPVVSARFNDGRNEPGCTRSYCGVLGAEGINVTLGIVGDPDVRHGNGWQPRDILGQRSGVTVTRVVRV